MKWRLRKAGAERGEQSRHRKQKDLEERTQLPAGSRALGLNPLSRREPYNSVFLKGMTWLEQRVLIRH